MRQALATVLCLLLLAGLGGCASRGHRDTLYQVSTLDALRAGEYEGAVPVGELRRHGEMGLGTFDALDGEMVAVDGEFYQVRADGHAYATSERLTSPFAVVTWFERDITESIGPAESTEELWGILDSFVSAPNAVYAVCIEGEFDYVSARSVPSQEKPYPPLQDIVENQVAYTYRSVRGVMVGFRMPEALRGLNAPGYHLHFLNHARTRGGHVLDCAVRRATVHLDKTDRLQILLPHVAPFRRNQPPAGAAATEG
jgi:acetolactate decarboxylase